jgi:predicted NAD/FAD-binding protein
MNILQGIEAPVTFVVTLNHSHAIEQSKILKRFQYDHPVFNHCTIAAQLRRSEINGVNNSWFCGAYWYNGFHEDGVRSAVDIARAMGVEF